MMRRRRRGHAPGHGLDILNPGPRTAASADGAQAGSTTTVMDEAELLSVPATTDDLDAALVARPRRARLPRLTVVLTAAVLIGGGFLGGVQVGKQSASASTSGFPGGGGLPSLGGSGLPSGGFPGGGAAAGGGSGAARGLGGFAGASGTFGTIKLVDHNTIYVQSATGGIIRVTTSPATKIQITTAGQTKDLRPGEMVTVQGTRHGSGLVAASSITQSGSTSGG